MLIEHSFDVLNVESDKEHFVYSDSFELSENDPKIVVAELGSAAMHFHNLEVEFIFQLCYKGSWLQAGQPIYWHPTVRPFLLDVPYPLHSVGDTPYELGVRYYPRIPSLRVPHNLQIRLFKWVKFNWVLVNRNI